MRQLTSIVFVVLIVLLAGPLLAQRPAGFVRSVDVMKYTKDVMDAQPDDARIENIVATLRKLNVDYIALAIPMDASDDYPAGRKPVPRDAYALTQKWADTVHNAGLRVLWRGTWSGIEGLYGFEKRVGEKRYPAGNAASAPTDGRSTWLGKMYDYIVSNPTFSADGDIWAPLPERTENIFQERTSFLPHDSEGIQANYVRLFSDLKRVSEAAFLKIGKKVITGMTANNYTEVKSGWLPQAFFEAQGIVAIDYYGNDRTPQEMDRDIRQMSAMHKRPVFIQEWSDYWNGGVSESQRSAYLSEVYAVMQKLADDGVLVGFNYWGGWSGTAESVIEETDGGLRLNGRGVLLGELFSRLGPKATSPTSGLPYLPAPR